MICSVSMKAKFWTYSLLNFQKGILFPVSHISQEIPITSLKTGFKIYLKRLIPTYMHQTFILKLLNIRTWSLLFKLTNLKWKEVECQFNTFLLYNSSQIVKCLKIWIFQINFNLYWVPQISKVEFMFKGNLSDPLLTIVQWKVKIYKI
jgi:hypothetical protein